MEELGVCSFGCVESSSPSRKPSAAKPGLLNSESSMCMLTVRQPCFCFDASSVPVFEHRRELVFSHPLTPTSSSHPLAAPAASLPASHRIQRRSTADAVATSLPASQKVQRRSTVDVVTTGPVPVSSQGPNTNAEHTSTIAASAAGGAGAVSGQGVGGNVEGVEGASHAPVQPDLSTNLYGVFSSAASPHHHQPNQLPPFNTCATISTSAPSATVPEPTGGIVRLGGPGGVQREGCSWASSQHNVDARVAAAPTSAMGSNTVDARVAAVKKNAMSSPLPQDEEDTMVPVEGRVCRAASSPPCRDMMLPPLPHLRPSSTSPAVPASLFSRTNSGRRVSFCRSSLSCSSRGGDDELAQDTRGHRRSSSGTGTKSNTPTHHSNTHTTPKVIRSCMHRYLSRSRSSSNIAGAVPHVSHAGWGLRARSSSGGVPEVGREGDVGGMDVGVGGSGRHAYRNRPQQQLPCRSRCSSTQHSCCMLWSL
uniref:Uncharacterized protein n=1 Tax=Dunaliella tertiolecta TaxID=3047 RepID=A0A7S3QZX5_DUNTE